MTAGDWLVERCKVQLFFVIRHTKKRMKKLLKKRQSGALSLSKEDDDFENFLLATRMRKCFYNETYNILGNTYGMCVLQVVHSSFAIICCFTKCFVF